jgi:hypothetical protein
MRRILLLTILLAGISACMHRREVMYPATVGTRTQWFEVVSPTELKLAPGVQARIMAGPCGPKSGIVFLKNNNEGGYMTCGCVGESRGDCTTENDNPLHPSCRGSCVDSQGNPHACEMFGPLPGPPRNPLQIELSAAALSHFGTNNTP